MVMGGSIYGAGMTIIAHWMRCCGVCGPKMDGHRNVLRNRGIGGGQNMSDTSGGWISVKELLPEEHADEHPYEFEQFLCATVWDDVRMVGFGTRIGDDKQHFWSGNSIWDDWVTHWMPLPEPPEVN